MAYKPGESGNPNGRPVGSRGKFTSLKDSFLDAFEDAIGTDGLIEWVNKSPHNKAMFLKLITKMLPTQQSQDIKGKLDGDHTLTIEVVKVEGGESGK